MTYSKDNPYPSDVALFLRVPVELKEKVKRLAKTNNMSVNHYMTGLINSLEEKVETVPMTTENWKELERRTQ